MRNAFIDELTALAKVHPHIALVVGDLGYSVVEPFADLFPDRFINAGVAEQNMTGLAAGMASEGYHVFTYSIANFPTFRCAEQIRNDVDYHRLPVTIVSVGGGLAYGSLGYSHHAIQDYALMRTLPNMLIAAPGDPMEVRSCLRYLIDNPGPAYLRLSKAGEPNIHCAMPEVAPGRWLKLYEGRDHEQALVCTGAGAQVAMRWHMNVGVGRQERSIFSVPLWSMKTKRLQRDLLNKFKKITTIEDHLVDGGFGSWMLEASVLASNGNEALDCRIIPVALDASVCDTVGSHELLNTVGGLSSAALFID